MSSLEFVTLYLYFDKSIYMYQTIDVVYATRVPHNTISGPQ